MPRRIFWSLLVTLGMIVSASISLYSQSTYGSIAGSVTDTSGASITDATVTLTNLGTQEKRTQSSGADGLYTFVNLFPGQYRVDVEKQGFKHFAQTAITVDVQQSTRVDAALQVGEVSQVVEVTSATPLLQAETSSLGTVVDQREANELPLNGRNIFNLTTITPSVIPQGSTEGNVVGKNPFDFANYQIGGAFANEGAEYLDGQPLNIGYINLPFLVPTQDSISEFKVQDNNLGPEWGKFAGGVINMSTKSGTNTWHGEGYEYLRNKVLNANEFFNKQSEVNGGLANKPVPFTQNQFGAAGGGAIIKNRTFVFGSYEGFRLRTGTPFNTTVPTVAERGGDFSDLCTSGTFTTPDPNGSATPVCDDKVNGVPVHQLYNPIQFTTYSNTGGVVTVGNRVPFANNNITAAINPSSAFLLNKLIANPTTGGTVLNFLKDASTGGDTDEYVARVDQTINSKQTLFGRFTYWKLLSLAQDPFGTGLCKDRCAENTKSKSVALGYNYAINSNTIFNLGASISRFIYLRDPINSSFDMSQEGWPSAYNALVPNEERTPLTPCFGQNDSLVGCSQGQSAIGDFNTQFNISPQVTMIRGHHTYVWGMQLEEGYDNYLQTNTGGGLISFGGSWTSATPGVVGAGNVQGAGAGNGEDFADFLLGYGNGQGAAFGNQTSGSLVISGPISGKQTYRAFYFGDTWHATPKLTLNIGARYELQGPWSERYDKMTYFNPAATNSSVTGCSGTAGSSCPGDLFLVKTGVNSSRNNLPLSKKEFLPRLGFAYSVDSKTVIRGGYGIFFIPNYVSFNANPYVDPVSSATSNFFSSNDHGVTPAASLNANTCSLTANGVLTCAGAGPFNQGSYNTTTGAPIAGANNLTPVPGRNPQPNVSQYILTQNNFSATGYTVQKFGYLEQYNLDIQRQLPAGFFADVAYAGSHGVHLEQSNTNINQIPDSFIAQAASQFAAGQTVTIAQPVATYPFSQALPGGLGPGVLINGQLDRPYPQYAGLNLNGFGCCGSNYNALQATVTRRFQGGGTMLVSYTNSKLMSNTDTLTSWLEGGTTGGVGAVQDWNNLKGERSLSSQDIPQRLVASYVVDLPFGHGKKFLSGMSGFGNAVVSGWGLDGITTLQRGFPVKISWGGGDALSQAGLGIGTLRPDYVGGCDKNVGGSSLHRVSEWFNTSCFTAPSGNNPTVATPINPWTFGNEPRVDATLRQQGVVNFDFAVFKRTTIMERLNVEFRAEFFDLFNHPQFGPPNSTVTSSTFGVVTNTVNSTFRIAQFGLKFIF
ncbi:MAG: carboxypeptidase-like regulatory domain-containing protein [Candidatus Sulfotelmatobacter sp.]